jgi:hypothetical protein
LQASTPAVAEWRNSAGLVWAPAPIYSTREAEAGEVQIVIFSGYWFTLV